MNLRTTGGAIALAVLIGTGIAADRTPVQAQAASPQYWLRGERGSAKNLVQVDRRLEGMIDQLQHDQRDYGGYRVRAIAALQQARADIEEAIEYDRAHPGH
jgi:hypothetical protein